MANKPNNKFNSQSNDSCCNCKHMDKKIAEICKKVCPGGKGEKGDPGENGITPNIGENGNIDTGVSASGSIVKGWKAQMQGWAGSVMTAFTFDTIIHDNIGTINTTLSTIIINEPGEYKIDWQASYDANGLSIPNGIIIVFSINGTVYSRATVVPTGGQTGQICGSEVFDSKNYTLPLTLAFVNDSKESVRYGNVPVQANATILKLS